MVRCMALSLTSACRVLAPGARLKNEHMSTSSLTLWIPYWISGWRCQVPRRRSWVVVQALLAAALVELCTEPEQVDKEENCE